MTNSRLTYHFVIFAIIGFFAACGKTNKSQDAPCVEHNGICAGVAETTLGSSTYHTADAVCASVLYVRHGASGGNGTEQTPFGDLPEAAAAASPGDCVALARGQYSAATLDGGISLLGKGAAETTVVTTATMPLVSVGGSNTVIRGVRLTGDNAGLYIGDSNDTRVESVHVDRAYGTGIQIQLSNGTVLRHVRINGVRAESTTGAAAGVVALQSTGTRIENSLIESCEGAGIVFVESDLAVDTSVVRNNVGYGIASSCPGCVEPYPVAIVRSTLVSSNLGVGVFLKKVTAVVEDNVVSGTIRNRNGLSRSVEASLVPDVQMGGNTVNDGEDVGVFLLNSSGTITGDLVTGHMGRGVWVQKCTAGPDCAAAVDVEILNTDVTFNHEMGVGVKGQCTVTVAGGSITDTIETDVATGQGYEYVGDGLQILPESFVEVAGVVFGFNERTGTLVDNPETFVISNSSYANPEESAIVVQNMGTWEPSTSVVENTTEGGAPLSYTEPSTPLWWDPNDVGMGADPGEEVGMF